MKWALPTVIASFAVLALWQWRQLSALSEMVAGLEEERSILMQRAEERPVADTVPSDSSKIGEDDGSSFVPQEWLAHLSEMERSGEDESAIAGKALEDLSAVPVSAMGSVISIIVESDVRPEMREGLAMLVLLHIADEDPGMGAALLMEHAEKFGDYVRRDALP